MPRKHKGTKYKLKTYKAAAKRFRTTGSGLIVRTKGGKSHFRRRKSRRVLQQLDKVQATNKSFVKRIRILAPYLGKYKANPPA